MKRTYAYGAATNQGQWPVQEDGFFVDPSRGLFVLTDGFGGRGNGDIAAKLALQEWRAAKFNGAPREGGMLSPAQAWHRETIVEINKKILQWNEKRSAGARGGCSLVVASVEKERELTVTSCGACATFLVRAGSWLPLLAPQAAPRTGAGEALYPQQALGTSRELNPESRSFLWEPGDLLFLFSSGLGWEREGFQADIAGQLALRMPGGDLRGIATLAADAGGPEGLWNRTAVAVESLW